MSVLPSSTPIDALRAAFGAALQENASLAGYTTARAGGPADALLVANSPPSWSRSPAACGSWSAFLRAGLWLECAGQRQRAARGGVHQPRPGHSDRSGKRPAQCMGRIGALIGTIARQAG